jgi:pentatricopeptide repeat protein
MAASPEPRDQISQVFLEALEHPSAGRAQFVRSRCGNDSARLQAVLKLVREFENLGSFLERPGASHSHDTDSLPQGTILNGRFEICERIGQGGMGVVYQAEDRELGEIVALKMVRQKWLDDEGILARFRDEIRLARKVAHPNICRIHDLFSESSGNHQRAFFTMEYLAGESLQQRMNSGWQPAVEETIGVLRDIAAGLDAAHAAGIVHSDLKPGNVMLKQIAGDPVGRAVLMDFGLARVFDRQDGDPSATLQIAGSPDFMAPEQFLGEGIGSAADIFALGVIAYLMTTGRLPWPAESLFRAALRRVNGDTNSIEFGAVFPPLWVEAIRRALSVDPAVRPRTAGEFARSLVESLAATAPLGAWISRRRLLGGLAAGGVVAGIWGTIRLRNVEAVNVADPLITLSPPAEASWQSGLFSFFKVHRPKIAAGSDILFTEISNSAGDAQLTGLSELFRSQLEQSTAVNFVSPERVRSVLRQMGKSVEDSLDPIVVREAAWRVHAAAVVFGTVAKVGPDLVLTVQVEIPGDQPAAPAFKKDASFSASDRQALMQTVRESALWVRKVVGESAEAVAQFDRLPEDATTPDWQALSFFAQAERLAQDNQIADAVVKLDAALGRDPHFTLAAMRKGDLLMSLNREADGLLQWRSAMKLLAERPLTRREELRIRGMFAFDSADYGTSDKYFAQWALEYPHDLRPLFYRTVPLILSGHAAEAVQYLEKVVTIDPNHQGAFAQLINCHAALGNFDQARAVLGRMKKLGDPSRCAFKSGQIESCEGDFERAWAEFDSLGRTDSRSGDAGWHLKGAIYKAMLLAEAGAWENMARLTEASAHRVAGRLADTDRAYQSILLAFAWLALGEQRRVAQATQAALELESGPIVLGHAGTVLARAGQLERAHAVLAHYIGKEDMVLYRLGAARVTGEIALARGDRQAALEKFQSAAAVEPHLALRSYLVHFLETGHEFGPATQELIVNVARNPFLVWLNPMEAEPGCWGHAVRQRPEDGSFKKMDASLKHLANFVAANSTLTL